MKNQSKLSKKYHNLHNKEDMLLKNYSEQGRFLLDNYFLHSKFHSRNKEIKCIQYIHYQQGQYNLSNYYDIKNIIHCLLNKFSLDNINSINHQISISYNYFNDIQDNN
jgi:hypothetical protein